MVMYPNIAPYTVMHQEVHSLSKEKAWFFCVFFELSKRPCSRLFMLQWAEMNFKFTHKLGVSVPGFVLNYSSFIFSAISAHTGSSKQGLLWLGSIAIKQMTNKDCKCMYRDRGLWPNEIRRDRGHKNNVPQPRFLKRRKRFTSWCGYG